MEISGDTWDMKLLSWMIWEFICPCCTFTVITLVASIAFIFFLFIYVFIYTYLLYIHINVSLNLVVSSPAKSCSSLFAQLVSKKKLVYEKEHLQVRVKANVRLLVDLM